MAAAAQVNVGQLLTKDKYYEVPMNGTKKEFSLKATVKGDTFNFMLDSGAPLFISKELQDRYQFRTLLRAKVKDVSGKTVRTEIVEIDTISMGPFVFAGVPAIVVEVANNPLSCHGIWGNIGSNLLRHLIVGFDAHEHKIIFTDNIALLPTKPETTHRLWIDGQSDAYFAVSINGAIEDTVHFDSGDGQLYSIAKNKAEKIMSTYPSNIARKGYGTVAMGIGGLGKPIQQCLLKPTNLAVGQHKLAGGIIAISGNNKSRMGRELLQYGTLLLNYKDSSYAFQPYSPAYSGTYYDYGFKLLPSENKVVASCVWDNSEAQQQGMVAGDEVLAVNNTDFASMSRCSQEAALREFFVQNPDSAVVTYRHKRQKPKTITVKRQTL